MNKGYVVMPDPVVQYEPGLGIHESIEQPEKQKAANPEQENYNLPFPGYRGAMLQQQSKPLPEFKEANQAQLPNEKIAQQDQYDEQQPNMLKETVMKGVRPLGQALANVAGIPSGIIDLRDKLVYGAEQLGRKVVGMQPLGRRPSYEEEQRKGGLNLKKFAQLQNNG